jgi:hypothetical protein
VVFASGRAAQQQDGDLFWRFSFSPKSFKLKITQSFLAPAIPV